MKCRRLGLDLPPSSGHKRLLTFLRSHSPQIAFFPNRSVNWRMPATKGCANGIQPDITGKFNFYLLGTTPPHTGLHLSWINRLNINTLLPLEWQCEIEYGIAFKYTGTNNEMYLFPWGLGWIILHIYKQFRCFVMVACNK